MQYSVWSISGQNRKMTRQIAKVVALAGLVASVLAADRGPASSEHHIKTVWVIVMENQNWSSIRGNKSAPYMNQTVLPIASNMEQYFNPPTIIPACPTASGSLLYRTRPPVRGVGQGSGEQFRHPIRWEPPRPSLSINGSIYFTQPLFIFSSSSQNRTTRTGGRKLRESTAP